MPVIANPLLQKLERRDFLSGQEKEVLAEIKLVIRNCRAGDTIVARNGILSESVLLVNGWAGRVITLKNGKRQITALHIIGDFVDLHSFVLKRLDHSIEALTPCRFYKHSTSIASIVCSLSNC